MYFRNRADAGRKLAIKLEHLRPHNAVVVCLSDGAAIVGAQIAMRLHANMMLLLTENIVLPGERDAIAAITSTGNFTYNNMFSPGQLEELATEFRQHIDAQRLEKIHRLNVLMGHEGEIHLEYLRHHVVVLVSDGLVNGYSLDVAYDFLKTVAIKRLVIASPFASVDAVDRMHLVGDEICCLNVVNNFITVNHYYDDNTVPKTKDLFRMMNNISLHWK